MAKEKQDTTGMQLPGKESYQQPCELGRGLCLRGSIGPAKPWITTAETLSTAPTHVSPRLLTHRNVQMSVVLSL